MIFDTDTSATWIADDGWSLSVTKGERVQHAQEYTWGFTYGEHEYLGRGLLGPAHAGPLNALQVLTKFALADADRQASGGEIITHEDVASFVGINVGVFEDIYQELVKRTGME